jgi:hypothetical protein
MLVIKGVSSKVGKRYHQGGQGGARPKRSEENEDHDLPPDGGLMLFNDETERRANAEPSTKRPRQQAAAEEDSLFVFDTEGADAFEESFVP